MKREVILYGSKEIKLTHRVGVLDEETQKKADKAYAVNGGIA